jgi:putative DNA primase/helicase
MPNNLKTCVKLMQALFSKKPKRRATYVDGSGWVNAREQFIFQQQVIGPPLPEDQMIRDDISVDPRCQLSRRGTAETWRHSVGRLAQHSSLMICLCGAAFGAPLLDLLSMEGFGLCIFGPSRSGKSLATRVIASIIGLAELPAWSLTKSWLGEHEAKIITGVTAKRARDGVEPNSASLSRR